MAGTETKRIIELTEASTVQSGDFIAVDSNARGTKKVPTSTLATSAALTAETNARTGADEQMSERMDGIEEQTALIQNPTKTLSGALCSFTDGADMPMVACTAEIVPKQSGTGTPSPDNVRQISGWESVNVDVSGRNLLDNSNIELGTSSLRYARAEGYGTPFTLKANTTYTISCNNTTIASGVYIHEPFSGTNVETKYNATSITYTPTEDVQVGFTFYWANGRPSDATHIQVEYGTTATAYEPYTGTTTSVNLGRTVCGGTLDVVSGVLTVDRAMVDLGTLNWAERVSGTKQWIANMPSASITPVSGGDKEALCECYMLRTSASLPTNGQFIVNNTALSSTSKICCICDTGYTSASDFKSAMSGVKLIYSLATPQTYQLTPTEVKTLLGENNVWADSGDVEITYRRDISIVLENLENALNGSNSLNTMMMSAPTENTAEEPTEDEAEDDMR